MKRWIIVILALLLAACGSARQSLPTPNGNDIQLSGGAYADYTITVSGTAQDPIVVYGNGSTLRCVLITGSYIVWRDTTVRGCDTFGIRVKGAHNQIINNVVTDVVRRNWDGAKCGGSGSWDRGISVSLATDILVSGNLVFRVCGEGIGVLMSSDVIVENNIVYDTFSVNLYPDNSNNVIIRNNRAYSTGDTRYYRDGKPARGLLIGAESYAGWGFQVHDLLVEGNTFERSRGISYYAEVTGTPSNVIVRNNHFVNVTAPLVSLGSWAKVSGNVSVTPTPGGTAVTLTPTVTATITPTPTASATPVPATSTPTATATPSEECIYFPLHDQWVCLK
ncbi:MAG: right-handed parallel beta-helix repeat-containing protein [Chloroflexi bacterium]|nr:right-handed parallel beta-helix repeat-containing protein [Chloroflexota bacterium]